MRALFMGICLISSLTVYGQKKLKFEKVNAMPIGVMAFGYGQSQSELFAIGGTGVDQVPLPNLQVFNVHIDKWLNVPLKNLPGTKFSSAVFMDEYQGLFTAGGVRPNGNELLLVDEIRLIHNDYFRIDTLGKLPAPAKNLGLAYDNKKVYLFGGGTSVRLKSYKWERNFSNKLYVYNLENGNLSELSDLPMAMETKGGVIDGRLYTFGGYNGKSLREIWRYDLEQGVWEQLKSLKKPLTEYALTQYEHYFILVGGVRQEDRLIVYNTVSQQAHYFKTNLFGKQLGASVMEGELHVYGGRSKQPHLVANQGHFKIPLKTIIEAVESGSN